MGQSASCIPSMHALSASSVFGSAASCQSSGNGNDYGSIEQLTKTIRVPLTEREVFTITKSWKMISSNMTHTGIAMFLRMFETRSDVMAMFEQFRTVDKAELGTNRSLENHALLVMNALDEAIANMDDPEYLIELLLATGKSHQRFENFSTSIFWAIEEPFIVAVRETLHDRFTPGVERIYRKTIKFILTTLTTGFRCHDPKDNVTSVGVAASNYRKSSMHSDRWASTLLSSSSSSSSRLQPATTNSAERED